MASEIGGLEPLHGYLKHGNLVVRMRIPYLELEEPAEKFIERKMTTPAECRRQSRSRLQRRHESRYVPSKRSRSKRSSQRR